MKKYVLFVILVLATAYAILYLSVKTGFVLPTAGSLAVLITAVSMDFLSTHLCLRAKGREGNPVIAFLFKKLTVWGTFGLMACIWIAFIWLRFLPSNDYSQMAIAFTYWLVPGNNLIVLRRLKKRNLAQKQKSDSDNSATQAITAQ